MKKLIIALMLLIPFLANTQEKKEEAPVSKTYSEDEFQAAVQKEVEARFDKVKDKNMVNFSKELLEKEERLRIQELKLKKEKEQLDIHTADLDKKIIEFREKQMKLIGCIDEMDKNKAKRVDHMVDVISGMKPANAADILSVQETEISIKILGLLSPEKVAKIFNLMDKEISARLQKQYMNMKK